MIIPLSFPGIDTVTKFKLPSCPENVSFMCVLYTQAFSSFYLVLEVKIRKGSSDIAVSILFIHILTSVL